MASSAKIEQRILDIQILIASDNVQAALQHSMDLARDCCQQQNEVLHTLIVISSNYSKITKEQNMGILNYDTLLLTRNQLLHQLLRVLDQFQSTIVAMA